jgi:biopolymer transport protein ExbD
LEAPQLSAKIIDDLKDKDTEIQRLKEQMQIMKISIEQSNSVKLNAKDLELAEMRKDLESMHKLILNLKPVLENLDEIKEYLQNKREDKEAEARRERNAQELEEKRRAKKELGI